MYTYKHLRTFFLRKFIGGVILKNNSSTKLGRSNKEVCRRGCASLVFKPGAGFFVEQNLKKKDQSSCTPFSLPLLEIPKEILDNFPPVTTKRTLYFDKLSSEVEDELITRGYNVVRILTLPRELPGDNIRYLDAKAQGIEEGTIQCTAIQFRTLELEMKAAAMLNNSKQNTNINVKMTGKDLDELLGWGKSRHTLRGNTTVVEAEIVED
jgi:hypothetical protein